MTISVMAKVDTSNIPRKVYCQLSDYLWAYKVFSNCKAFLNGEIFYICPRYTKVLGKA